MKKYKILSIMLGAALTLGSCTNDFLDINEDPNNINLEDITPELMLPGVISQAYQVQAGTMTQFGNVMMNSWAGNSYTYGSPFSSEYNLSAVDNAFYTGIWSGLYPRVGNLYQIENYKNENNENDKYVVIAKILKAFYMQYIVDLYGDVPYSEAFKGQQNLTPAYDDDKDVYKSLIEDLNKAINMLDNLNVNANDPGAADIIFKGNMVEWKRFANTLKLRYLIRMSNVTGEMATYRDAQLATLPSSSSGYIMSDVIENPGYSSANDSKLNPFVSNWFRNTGGFVTNYSFITISEHMATVFNGNASNDPAPHYAKFNGKLDPRGLNMFTRVNQFFRGIRQGALPGDEGAPAGQTNVSQFTYKFFAGDAQVQTYADVLDAANNKGGTIMSLAEAKFLQAEAALRYPSIFTGNAKQLFDEGVKASFDWLGTPANYYPFYINNITNTPGLDLVGTFDQKLEAIMTQKWVALTCTNPTEMFIEYNRTGYPYTPMATTAQYNNKPYRLVYPISEYTANSQNVPTLLSSEVFVKNQYTPFWNQD